MTNECQFYKMLLVTFLGWKIKDRPSKLSEGKYMQTAERKSTMRKYFYVSPRTNDWVLTYTKKVLYYDPNKLPVVRVGRDFAKKFAPSELVIQRSDGTIENRETYGNDPFPPRG